MLLIRSAFATHPFDSLKEEQLGRSEGISGYISNGFRDNTSLKVIKGFAHDQNMLTGIISVTISYGSCSPVIIDLQKASAGCECVVCV